MNNIFEALIVLGWSTVKFMVGVAHATVFFDLDFLSSMLLTVGGGMLGFYLFVFLDKPIMWVLKPLAARLRKRNGGRVKFSRKKRFIIKIKNRYGLLGISLLTPLVLMVPIGTFMAMRLRKDLKKVSLYMLASFTLYALVFCGMFHLLPSGIRGFAAGFIH